MRTLKEKTIATLFNNSLGGLYLGVPKGKKIYKITKSSAHYYTGDIAKNGMPIICTGDVSPNGRNKFIYWLETWKPIHLCWLFDLMGWKIPKYFIGLDTGAKAPTATGTPLGQWLNGANAYATDGVFTTKAGNETDFFRQDYKTFGFGIPAGATINGIEYVLTGKVNSGTETINIYVFDGTARKKKTQVLTTTNTAYTLGGAADLWTGSWVADDMSDANFYASIEVIDTTLIGYSVDSITVKVYYTEVSNLANLKSYNTNLKANIKSIDTNLIANIKSLDTNV